MIGSSRVDFLLHCVEIDFSLKFDKLHYFPCIDLSLMITYFFFLHWCSFLEVISVIVKVISRVKVGVKVESESRK